jgi:ABC-type antimicrobial peptide transport system permease subunit
LRLLGTRGLTLTVFPLASGLLLTLGGLAGGFAVYFCVGSMINRLFRSHLEAGERFCSLTPGQQGAAIVIALGLALLAGLMASRRVATIDPAESLRDE